jgi:hypothetical protein
MLLRKKDQIMASQPYFRSRGLSEDAEHARALLLRYPELSDEELASLINRFAGLPLLDFGLMAADERLGAKLDAFYADHGDKLRPPLWGMGPAIAVPALVVALAIIYLVVA